MRNKMLAALLLIPTGALAHVTLAAPGALPGAHYQARFHIGHGCSGAPTTALSIVIPEGLGAVQAAPKPGWTLETTRTGTRISSITWKGGVLAADAKDDFVVHMMLPAKPVTLAFAATQTCDKTVESWTELPAADGHRLTKPAPLLVISPNPAKTRIIP